MRNCRAAQGAQSVMTWREGMGEGREAHEEGDICIIITDLHCVAEIKKIL